MPELSAVTGQSQGTMPPNNKSQVLHPYPASRALGVSGDHRSLLRDRNFTAQFLDEIGCIVEKHGVETLSLDVFDTALLRDPHCEARRFYTVAEQFAKQCGECTVTDAFIARATAARAAYGFANIAPDGTREGTMTMIAEITCSDLCVPELTDAYIKTELAFEEKHLTANPLILALIAAFPSLRVIFLSDMYLESRHIKNLLQKSFGKSLEVISSADGYGSKRRGGLFQHTAEALEVDLSRALHFGDSLESDYRQAKRNGMHAYYLPISDVERAARGECYRALDMQLAPADVKLQSILSFNC